MSGPSRPVERPQRIAVCGGRADASVYRAAEAVGRELAAAGAVLVCGGRDGVMEAAARGAARAGGLTVGVLPDGAGESANPYISLPLATGFGEGRNILVVRFSECVIAIGGEWGTLSEVALARRLGLPVVLLHPGLTAGLDLPKASDAAEAAAWALESAREFRRAREEPGWAPSD